MAVRKKHPCPGCKQEHWGAATELCLQCQSDLALGRQTRKDATSEKGPIVAGRFGTAFRYYRRGKKKEINEPDIYAFLDDLKALVALPEPTEHVEYLAYYISESESYRVSQPVYMTKEHFDTLCRILDYVAGLSQSRYADGYNDGHNLLLGLARGRISPSEFNERVDRG